MGKTAFVLNIAQHVAFKANKSVAIFSLEMSKEQLVNRLFSLESRVDSQHIRTGQLSDAEWENLIESAGVIESRSSGMKGTYIKVVNDVVFEELDKLKKGRK